MKTAVLRKVFAGYMVLTMLLGFAMSHPVEVQAADQESLDNLIWRNPLPTGNDLYSVAYGNGKFVAVGTNGTILTSSDGTSWQTQNINTRSSFIDVTCENERFVAVGAEYNREGNTESIILESSDGVTWQEHTLHTSDKLEAVAYGNGRYVALGNYGTILTSTDGMTWKEQKYSSIVKVTFVNGRFVAIGHEEILTSLDGVTWQVQTAGISNLISITYGNGKFVVISEEYNIDAEISEDIILTSSDGTTWKEQNLKEFSMQDVTYGNGKFVAVGLRGTILISTDGITWKKQTIGTNSNLFGVTYGNGKFVVVGNSGTILTSENGIVWKEQTSGISNDLKTITYGAGKYVAAGDFGTILTSEDGRAWQTFPPRTFDLLTSVTYGNGIYVAVGGDTALSSVDGITWKKKAFDEGHYSLLDVTFCNGKFAAVGYTGALLTSTDGVMWTEQQFGAGADASIFRFTNCNDRFVAIGVDSNYNGTILSSSDGAIWRAHDPSTANMLYDITYVNGMYVAVGGGGTILTSSVQSIDSSTLQKPGGTMAIPTSAKVLINGREVSFEAYNINGNNYFKIRDLAAAMNGTEKQFNVGYDDVKKAIAITSDTDYTAVGGERVKGNGLEKTAVKSPATISYDGSLIKWECYNIYGYNYTKLRDIGKTMNFRVTWNDQFKVIEIDTKSGYIE